jgi:hypothetical protein
VTSSITAALRALVVERADNRCEYCQLAQDGQEATFHVDHVIPLVADGPTDEANLALACVGCSLRKGARQHAIDPEVGTDAPLFNPRTDAWSEHFAWDGVMVTGRSATGRATTAALAMNRPLMVAIREEEVILGRHAGD